MKWFTKTNILGIVLLIALSPCALLIHAQDEVEPAPAKDYFPFPDADSGYVTDTADLLTDDEEEEIEVWLWQTESKTNVEIVVVTVFSIKDYPGAPNASIEQFATGLFDKYGIGNMPENNGVLLVVAVKDKKARIELGSGYGRAGDGDAARIMNGTIVPHFKKGDYKAGIIDGVKAIMLEFAGVRVGWNWSLIIVLISIPICAIVAYSLFKSGKRGWGWVFVGLIFVLILAAIWIIIQAKRHMPKSSSSSWSPGGFGGGFGGGFSGGGGATGSW